MKSVSREQKVLFVLLALGLVLAVAMGVFLQRQLLPAIKSYESEGAANAVARVEQALAGRLDLLEMLNLEYSEWTETYNFILDPEGNADFVQDEMYPEDWSAVGIELVMLLDADGDFVWGHLTEYAGGPEVTLDDVVLPFFTENPLLNSSAGVNSHTRGLVHTPVGVMLIVSKPVVHDDIPEPAAGSLLMGSILSGELAADIGRAAEVDLSIFALANPDLSDRLKDVAQRLDAEGAPFFDANLKQKRYAVSLLRDLYGDPVAVVESIWDKRGPMAGDTLFNQLQIYLFLAVAAYVLVAWLVILLLTRGPEKSNNPGD